MAGQDAVQVVVREGWLVVDPSTGEQVGGGKRLSVPEGLADQWTRAGWAEPAKPPAKRTTG